MLKRALLLISFVLLATPCYAGQKVTGDLTVSGNTGIGTTAPTYKMQVSGDAKFGSGSGTPVFPGADFVINASGSEPYAFDVETDGAINFLIGTGGTIYVGGAFSNWSSSNLFQITTNSPTITHSSSDAYPSLIVQNTHASATGDLLQVKNSSGTVFDINQSGNVGIGTTSPIYKLEVIGTTKSTDYYSGDGTQGMTGSCADGTSLTVKDGLVTACA